MCAGHGPCAGLPASTSRHARRRRTRLGQNGMNCRIRWTEAIRCCEKLEQTGDRVTPLRAWSTGCGGHVQRVIAISPHPHPPLARFACCSSEHLLGRRLSTDYDLVHVHDCNPSVSSPLFLPLPPITFTCTPSRPSRSPFYSFLLLPLFSSVVPAPSPAAST